MEKIILPGTQVRLRIEHSRTQRDGWGYSSTVEVTGEGVDVDLMERLLTEVRLLGERERDERNRRELVRNEAA